MNVGKDSVKVNNARKTRETKIGQKSKVKKENVRKTFGIGNKTLTKHTFTERTDICPTYKWARVFFSLSLSLSPISRLCSCKRTIYLQFSDVNQNIATHCNFPMQGGARFVSGFNNIVHCE